jgi:hypothetical protein
MTDPRSLLSPAPDETIPTDGDIDLNYIFTDILEGMLVVQDGEEYMSNMVGILGKSGVHHITVDQLNLWSGIVNGSSHFLGASNPLQFLINSYSQLVDMLPPKNYLVTTYELLFDHVASSLSIKGTYSHKASVKGHPDYDVDIIAPTKTFERLIMDVGLYGELALVNCLAANREALAPLKGHYGASFIFRDGADGAEFKTIPSPTDIVQSAAPVVPPVEEAPVPHINDGYAGTLPGSTND